MAKKKSRITKILELVYDFPEQRGGLLHCTVGAPTYSGSDFGDILKVMEQINYNEFDGSMVASMLREVKDKFVFIEFGRAYSPELILHSKNPIAEKTADTIVTMLVLGGSKADEIEFPKASEMRLWWD